MTDAEYDCFANLKKSAIGWTSALEGLERHVDEKRKEMAGAPDKRLATLNPSGSVTLPSAQQHINGDATVSSEPAEPSWVANIPLRRKRKPGSTASSAASGPQDSRDRTMIVVSYDKETQKVLQDVVQELGYGRNLVRKARMAATMNALTGALNEDGGVDVGPDGEVPAFKITSFRRARERGSRGRSHKAPAGEPTALDRADKALEEAQCACENGAYRFLRDGECKPEIDAAKQAFELIVKVSAEELLRLEALDRVKSEQSKPNGAGRTGHTDADGHVDDSIDGLTGLGPIEVDDSEEQMPVDLLTLRIASRREPRRTRS